MDSMLEDLQLLPPSKQLEPNPEIIKTHLETLLLLTTSREGRETLRKVKTYPVIRELHKDVEDEGVREGCDRLVQVLVRDEEGEGGEEEERVREMVREEETRLKGGKVEEVDSDEEVVDVL